MGDALCGPSNSLQTFQKHTSVDRTLQQDRFTGRQSPVQGFRSTLSQNAGILDAEFEAFQAGGSRLPDFQPLAYDHNAASFHPNTVHSEPLLPNWASDFQSLQLGDAGQPQIPQTLFKQQAPQHHSSQGVWQQDFRSQQAQFSSQNQMQRQSLGDYSYSNNLSVPLYGVRTYPTNILSKPATEIPQNARIEDRIAEAAFERAFDAAYLEIQQSEDHMQREEVEFGLDFTPDGIAEEIMRQPSVVVEESRLESDLVQDEVIEEKQEDHIGNEADELARTAGQLLDNLKYDQSQKFQESSFLSLMRQLRDREVRVEGDKLVDTLQPLHPGGQFYPSVSSLFNDSEKSDDQAAGASTNPPPSEYNLSNSDAIEQRNQAGLGVEQGLAPGLPIERMSS